MKIICFGDSNTYGYDPRSVFGGQYDRIWCDLLAESSGWNVINQGENGREIPKSAVTIPDDTDLLIIMLGTNDLLQFWSPKDTCRKMENFLAALDFPRERTLLLAPPPMIFGAWVQDQELIDDSVTLAKHYHGLSMKMGVSFADTAQWHIPLGHDGVHFTEEGQYIFARELHRTILHNFGNLLNNYLNATGG